MAHLRLLTATRAGSLPLQNGNGCCVKMGFRYLWTEKKMLSLLEALPEQFTTTQAIEIGNLLGMSRASVYRYLASLQEEGLLSGDWGNYSKTN